MEAMSDTEILGGIVLNTPVDVTTASYAELTEFWTAGHAELTNLNDRLGIMRSANERMQSEISEFRAKVSNVKGVISDVYSEDGEIPEHLTDIARILDIELTKRISGTATFEISWSAEVPLGFDTDDFDISFDVDCNSYEAEDFEWQEEGLEIDASED